MSIDVIVGLVKDFGYPVAISIYLLYSASKQNDFFGGRLDDIKDILVDMSTQISYVLSANINYRSGNIETGDLMSKQSIYQAEKRKTKLKGSKTNADEGGDSE